MKRSTALAALVATVVALLSVWAPAPAMAAARPCSRGLVSLTFDDGPRPRFTPRLLDELARRNVKATFFMIGFRAQRFPELVRRIAREGHTIANHSWDHPPLITLPDRAIRAQLVRTHRALRAAGVRPSRLMRPPYGAINGRVRKVTASLGLVPVLWDGDTRDWESGNSRDIANRVLAQLRPHQRNIVLQHDGVTRSGQSMGAVPRIIRETRRRGYCFTPLDARGRQVMPVPQLRLTASGGSEATSHITVALELSRPVPRTTSVLLVTRDDTATGGADYEPVRVKVTFGPGRTHRTVTIPVIDDLDQEPVETVRVRLGRPRGLTLSERELSAAIISNDAPPVGSATPQSPVSALSRLLSLRAID